MPCLLNSNPIMSPRLKRLQLKTTSVTTSIKVSLKFLPVPEALLLYSSKGKTAAPHFYIDYQKLIAVTCNDSFPLPQIDDAFDHLICLCAANLKPSKCHFACNAVN